MFGFKNSSTESHTIAQAIPPAPPAEGGEELESLWKPSQSRQRTSVEQILLERGKITEEQLDQAKKVKEQTPGKSLVQILQTMNAAADVDIVSAQAHALGIPFETPQKAQVEPEAFAMLQVDYIRKNLALPLRFEESVLVVGLADPSNVFLYDEVKRNTRRNVKVVAVA